MHSARRKFFISKYFKKLKGARKILKRKGFTLIELLVVISVIGILAAFSIAALSGAQSRGRDAQRKNDLDQIKIALQMYYNDKDGYPIASGWSWETNGYEGPTGWIPNLAPTYIKKLPSDPRKDTAGSDHPNCTGEQKQYGYTSDGTDYKVIAHCTPEYYGESARNFIDPTRDADASFGGDGICGDAVIYGENTQGDGLPWGWAIWSSDASKCL